MSESGGPRFEVIEGWLRLPEGLEARDVVGVQVDSDDRLFVFARGEPFKQDLPRVMVFERDGTFVTAWGEGLFNHSHGFTLGPDGSVYCTDDLDHTIRKFTPDGKLLMTLGTSGVASDTGYVRSQGVTSIVRGAPPFNRPTNLAVAPNGDLYVTDGYGNARVHRFSADGRLLHSWGVPGTGPGQFHTPHDVEIAPDGRLLVADRENERIQIFSPNGEYLDQWTDLQRPAGLFIDRDGLVYVVELWWQPGNRSMTRGLIERDMPGRISVFDLQGNLLARWGGVAEAWAPGNVAVPHAACVDSHGDLYVGEVCWTMRVMHDLQIPPDCHTLQKFARVR